MCLQKAILQFAKSPRLGEVKTRMRGHYSEQECLDLHIALVNYTLNMLAQTDCAVELWTTDPEIESFDYSSHMQLWCYKQEGRDLGERIIFALQQAFLRWQKIILIGSDCPEIDSEYITEAWQKLNEVDVVIGPAHDGGYVLIGLNHFIPEIFYSIDWGTEQVLAQTLERIKSVGKTHCCLGTLHDIDRPEDLEFASHIWSGKNS